VVTPLDRAGCKRVLQVGLCVGVPLAFDARQVGSYAHRLRAAWTNLGDTAALETIIVSIVRRSSHIVQEILLLWCRKFSCFGIAPNQSSD